MSMYHFPCDSAGKESTCNVGDLGLIPGLGRSPGEGNGYPHQYSGLENSMDYTVQEITKSWAQLSDFHFTWEDHVKKKEVKIAKLCPILCDSMDYTVHGIF